MHISNIEIAHNHAEFEAATESFWLWHGWLRCQGWQIKNKHRKKIRLDLELKHNNNCHAETFFVCGMELRAQLPCA
jgi:hypothetical protein